MLNTKKWALVALLVALGAVVLAACTPTTETVEVVVTRVITETVIESGETVEVTRVVTETIVEEVVVEPEAPPAGPKDLIICTAQEPDSLYPYGTSMLASQGVQHAIFENNFTNLSFGYQAQGVEKLPSLADGDAVLEAVEVNAGDTVVDAVGSVVVVEDGVSLINSDGETVVFDGTPVSMNRLTVDFTMKPRVWSDGTPVTANDSIYSFALASDPDTPNVKFAIERTASYEATGDLSVRWTGVPGYQDSTYFVNFWQPLPEHAWGSFSAAELLEAEETSRLPMGDGAFVVQEWIAGDSIRLTRNEFYYQEGLPYLDSVTYKFIPDTNQLIAQLLSGACDIGTQDGMDVGQAPFLIEAENSGLLTPYFQTGTVYEHIDFGINSYDGYGDGIGRPDWFETAEVRQAMTMCTDRQSMVDNILFGRSEIIHTYIPSVHPLYPEGLTEWPYDVAAANEMLDTAGYVDSDGDGIRNDPITGVPFSVRLGTTAGNEMRQQLTQIFKENMLECGIDVTLEYVPASEWFGEAPEAELFGRRFDLGEFAWLTGVEPACALYLSDETPGPEGEPIPGHYDPNITFKGWGGQSQTGWINQDFDEACKRALGNLPGTDDYIQGHTDAQVVFSQEVPIIPLFLRLKVAAARPEILNFFVDPTQNSELVNIYEIDIQQ